MIEPLALEIAQKPFGDKANAILWAVNQPDPASPEHGVRPQNNVEPLIDGLLDAAQVHQNKFAGWKPVAPTLEISHGNDGLLDGLPISVCDGQFIGARFRPCDAEVLETRRVQHAKTRAAIKQRLH